jgi:hypothetical protein
MTGDLSSMTAPPFILSPVSLTEFPGEQRFLFFPLLLFFFWVYVGNSFCRS